LLRQDIDILTLFPNNTKLASGLQNPDATRAFVIFKSWGH